MDIFDVIDVVEAVFDVTEYVDERHQKHTDGIILEPYCVHNNNNKNNNNHSSIGKTATTTTIPVTWYNVQLQSRIGLVHIPRNALTKCSISEYFMVGNIVKATCDIPLYDSYGPDHTTPSSQTTKHVVVPNGTRGTLLAMDTNGDWTVDWWWTTSTMMKPPPKSTTVGGTTTTKSGPISTMHLKKCDPKHYFQVGDVVQATRTFPDSSGVSVSSGSTKVRRIIKGTLGTIQKREVTFHPNGTTISWMVRWTLDRDNSRQVDILTTEKYIQKCDQSKHWKVNEVIKAKADLIWTSGLTVPKGTFGTLKEWIPVITNEKHDSKNDTVKWMVQWWNGSGVNFGHDNDDAVCSRHNQLTMTSTTAQEYIEKCHPSKYWCISDVLKTKRDVMILLENDDSICIPKGTQCQRVS